MVSIWYLYVIYMALICPGSTSRYQSLFVGDRLGQQSHPEACFKAREWGGCG
jgi:hypothetical protein